jgi:short-subunit dehydrogenase
MISDGALEQSVKGRKVLITGASSGIGKAAAIKVGAAGGTVLLVARRRELLEETKSEIEGRAGVADLFVCDLSDSAEIDQVAAEVLEKHGHVDVLVNNAGRSIRRAISNSYDRFHDFERTMQLNYFGPVKLILNLLPVMRQRGSGHIINVSTAGVQLSAPMFSAYLASKAALDAFARSIRFEVAADGVDLTTVYMPLVRTAMAAPTRMYDTFPALSPEEAADLICQAIRNRPTRVATLLGNLAHVAHAAAPGLDHSVNSAVGRLLLGRPWRKRGLPLGAAGERPAVDDQAMREAFRRRLDTGQVAADPVEVQRLTRLLRRTPLFEACTADELQQIASTAYPIAFEESEALCVEGAESADCYVIVEGEGAVSIKGKPVGVVRASEVVGERAPIEGQPRAATVTATTRVLAYAISRDRLEEILSSNPSAAGHMRRLVRARYAHDAMS